MPEAIRELRPYRWGTFQGWSNFVLGGSIFLAGPFHASLSHRLASYLIGAVLIVVGIGLVGKRRIGFVLFMVVGMFVTIGELAFPAGKPEVLFLIAGWWVVPAIFYYPKRWKETSSKLLNVDEAAK